MFDLAAGGRVETQAEGSSSVNRTKYNFKIHNFKTISNSNVFKVDTKEVKGADLVFQIHKQFLMCSRSCLSLVSLISEHYALYFTNVYSDCIMIKNKEKNKFGELASGIIADTPALE